MSGPLTENGVFLRDGLLALGFSEDYANERIIAIEVEAADLAVKEIDAARAAAPPVEPPQYDSEAEYNAAKAAAYASPDRPAGLREAAQAVVDHFNDVGVCRGQCREMDALRALLDSDKPGPSRDAPPVEPEHIVLGPRKGLTEAQARAQSQRDLAKIVPPSPDPVAGLRDGNWDAMNAALSRTFPIYADPEGGADIDGDINAMMEALRDYGTGYIVVSIDRLNAALLASDKGDQIEARLSGEAAKKKENNV